RHRSIPGLGAVLAHYGCAFVPSEGFPPLDDFLDEADASAVALLSRVVVAPIMLRQLDANLRHVRDGGPHHLNILAQILGAAVSLAHGPRSPSCAWGWRAASTAPTPIFARRATRSSGCSRSGAAAPRQAAKACRSPSEVAGVGRALGRQWV